MVKGRGIKKNFTEKTLVDAIEKCKGNKSAMAEMLNCGRTTINRELKKFPKTERVFKEVLEGTLDKAEKNIFDAVGDGNLDISKWLLTKLGKGRGYGDRLDISAKIDPIVLESGGELK